MVIFKDLAKDGLDYLFILKREGESLERAFKLPVHTPMHGRFTPKSALPLESDLQEWLVEVAREDGSTSYSLQSSIHTGERRLGGFETLGRRIIGGSAYWTYALRLNGEFSFVPMYWEWLEEVLGRSRKLLNKSEMYHALFASLFTYDRNSDIVRAFLEAWSPETNTLHTSAAELSLSLWDLHKVGGLPIYGGMYEEVIPFAKKLTGMDEEGKRFIPQSCEHLFAAYHQLHKEGNKKQNVSVSEWVKFWFKGDTKYHQPKVMRHKKASRPKLTQNPNGSIGAPRKWSSAEEAVFKGLGVKNDLWEETHLAAFISCWLCVFALPNGDEKIRPTTFKAASIMANRRKLCLGVPVLLKIYHGLNGIAESANPGRTKACLPMHYIYAWMVLYFRTC